MHIVLLKPCWSFCKQNLKESWGVEIKIRKFATTKKSAPFQENYLLITKAQGINVNFI